MFKQLIEGIMGIIVVLGGLLLLVFCQVMLPYILAIGIGILLIYVIWNMIRDGLNPQDDSSKSNTTSSISDKPTSSSKSNDLWGDVGWDDSGDDG